MNLDLVKAAAEQFVIRLLPDDKAKVGAFNDKIEFANAGFTSDRDELAASIKELDFGNATRLWDAVDQSLDELKDVDGRRVVVVFTDGDDTGSRVGLGRVIDRARADEAMVYAIGLESVMQPARRPRDSHASRSRPEAARRRDRRRLLRAEEDRGARARRSPASRRSSTASTCSASRRRRSTTRSTAWT